MFRLFIAFYILLNFNLVFGQFIPTDGTTPRCQDDCSQSLSPFYSIESSFISNNLRSCGCQADGRPFDQSSIRRMSLREDLTELASICACYTAQNSIGGNSFREQQQNAATQAALDGHIQALHNNLTYDDYLTYGPELQAYFFNEAI